MLKLKNVSLQFVKDYMALNNVNFTFEKGKIYNLVGGVGSGRASLLRCVAKLEKDFKGEIEYQGKNIQEINYATQLGVGLVPEVPVLLEKKDVNENLKFAIQNRDLAKNEEEKNYLINQILKSFELDAKSGVRAKKLDYFEKQKIAFARLSLRAIDILLVENIFDLINANEIKLVRDYVLKYFANKNSIVILASSNPLNEYFENLEIVNMIAGEIAEDLNQETQND